MVSSGHRYTPYGLGAYASRQTYMCSFSITQTGKILKEKILKHASELTRMAVDNLDVVNSNIVRKTDGRVLMSLADLATEVIYSLEKSDHITAESSYHITATHASAAASEVSGRSSAKRRHQDRKRA